MSTLTEPTGERRALLIERFGSQTELNREKVRHPKPRPVRGIAAPRCRVCLAEHDQALTAGRYPQPVRRVLAGSDRCDRHQRKEAA